MKKVWKEWLCVFLTSLLLPCVLTLLISGTNENATQKNSGIIIELENGDSIDREEFLIYMVAGQVDLDSNDEMLKAQSVIARTNLMRGLDGNSKAAAKDLDLVYLTPKRFENSFGETKRNEIVKKLSQIIGQTYPYVLTYEEKCIEALYHSVSAGRTVSAEEIFGVGQPYLIAVDSSQDVEAEDYMTLSAWTGRDLLAKLQGIGIGKEQTSDTVFSSLKIAQKTKNGYVKKVAVGEEQLSGDEWKNLFDLNSSHFYLEEQDGQLRMIVLGKGHGVGLSQYGANQMAKEGAGWKDILMRYYPGADITKAD